MNGSPMEEAASREARRWYARLLSSDCSSGERAAFERWREADPRNAAAYARVDGLMGRVDELRDDWGIRVAARDALRTAPAGRRRKKAASLAVAAAMVLAVGLGLFRLQERKVEVEHHATGVGEQRRVDLADGTALLLDTASAVDVRYSRGERRVALTAGRAEYQVAHDAGRPFVVEALGGTTTALGTRFQTDLRDGRVVVSLLEGSVAVEGPVARRRLTLAAGEQLAYDAGGTLWSRAPMRREAALGWTQGKLVFEDAPLTELLAEVNRYTDAKLRIADPAIETLRISGTFQANDQESLLLALQGIWGIQAQRSSPGEIVLSR